MMRLDEPAFFEPVVRPCVTIEPEPDSGLRVGIEQRYSALTEYLPLKGAEAMKLDSAGDVLLCEQLRQQMPWMEPAIAIVERSVRMALWAGRPWLSWSPFCLVGGPGSGKSHFARELARLGGLSCAALDLASMSDAAALAAVSRGWTNTKPCWPAQMIASFGTGNPLLVLDEIEKSGGSDRNGEPRKALLGMLEPSTAACYFDTCLMTEVNLSAVCWIATANSADELRGPLASRMEIVVVEGPAPEHFDLILEALTGEIARRWQISSSEFPQMPAHAVKALYKSFSNHRSVRLLKRHFEMVMTAILPVRRTGFH